MQFKGLVPFIIAAISSTLPVGRVIAAPDTYALVEATVAGTSSAGREREAADKAGPQPTRASMRRASNIIGSTVTNYKGEALGEVKELVLNLYHGDVAYVVISAGGLLGMGERWHAVPLASLQLNRERDGFIMNMDHEAWMHAPGFDKDRWPDLGSEQWNRTNSRYYRQHRERP